MWFCAALLCLLKSFITGWFNPPEVWKSNFCVQIVIISRGQMQQSEHWLFFCFIFLKPLHSFFSETSLSVFFLENPGPPSATMCWQKQLSQLPIMWAFPLLSTIKGFGKSCQINLFCNSWLYYEVDIMRFFIHQLNTRSPFFKLFYFEWFLQFQWAFMFWLESAEPRFQVWCPPTTNLSRDDLTVSNMLVPETPHQVPCSVSVQCAPDSIRPLLLGKSWKPWMISRARALEDILRCCPKALGEWR